MDIETTRAAVTQLLNDHYQIYTSELPTKRPKKEWQAENMHGYFLGVVQYGRERFARELHALLLTEGFADQLKCSSRAQLADPMHLPTFADRVFEVTIAPFHKNPGSSRSTTTKASKSIKPADDAAYEPNEPSHESLKRALLNRDRVCLFCWHNDDDDLQASHIIAQKTFAFISGEQPLLKEAGLLKHQVQNGLLLCIGCHNRFDCLKHYVDVDTVSGKLVLRVVNYSVLKNDDKHVQWQAEVKKLNSARSVMQGLTSGIRQAVESSGEMALYFADNDPALQPNALALGFQKAACLIWRMAGGGKADVEECSCDDDDDDCVPVDYRAKGIHQWLKSTDPSANILSNPNENSAASQISYEKKPANPFRLSAPLVTQKFYQAARAHGFSAPVEQKED